MRSRCRHDMIRAMRRSYLPLLISLLAVPACLLFTGCEDTLTVNPVGIGDAAVDGKDASTSEAGQDGGKADALDGQAAEEDASDSGGEAEAGDPEGGGAEGGEAEAGDQDGAADGEIEAEGPDAEPDAGQDAEPEAGQDAEPDAAVDGESDAEVEAEAAVPDAPEEAAAPFTVRLATANLSSGNGQDYDQGHGQRILQGIHPDIVMIQEFNYLSNTEAELRSFVDTTFGTTFAYSRESGAQIPNGVISRYPIMASGVWDDPQVSNREFAWAQIDLPGPRDLWAIGVHFLTSTGTDRTLEADALVAYLNAQVPSTDALVVLGGDLNTSSRTELCLTKLAARLDTAGPWPVDQNGNGNTSAKRSAPLDWLVVSPTLDAMETSVVIGANSFPTGLVVDTRVYTPISDLAPALQTDSAASNMQHMAVVRDFLIQ